MKELIKKLDAVTKELIKRYMKNALSRYNTGKIVHEKQLLFHKCQKRNRWVFGGNRSGKTECGAVECIWLARGIHPFRKNKKCVNGWVVSVSRQVQREVAQSKILHYLNPDWIVDVCMMEGKKEGYENGIIDYIVIKNVSGLNSKIYFKSADQGREKFQGASLDFVWFDEEPPEDIYYECLMRVFDKKGDIFGTMTPLKGLTWVYNEIYLNDKNNPEVWCENMTWEDNPFLDKSEIELLTSTLSESELESRKYGRFMSSGGLVYSEFDENIHVIEPFDVPLSWQDNISIDPGLNNPLSAHWYAVDYDGNVYVIAEHFEAKKDVVYHAEKIKEISNKLNWHRASNGMISTLIDSAASQRTLAAEKSVVELFYDNGILANPKVDKNLFAGISRVKSYLKNAEGKAKLFIFKTCTNLIREFKGYFWGKGDNPIKKDDHALDELRYYIVSRPETPKKLSEKSDIQKDKEKLIKKLSKKYY
ncbi:MAG TPA: hypothetical protein IAA62_01275 [Candidatus Caccopulliclostridium gallistercoris]|uniref:Terminase large subunit gp17-like C-terminal domain-containing protein n=1 Tax=Candidatus Caccopulliclostridium gallistercoris TaxID=2840719 RepID=A0A9D1NEN8_9FIRM|nr:hypothetical protein [Candidatus Caccopulliclostridium gallistercoris]